MTPDEIAAEEFVAKYYDNPTWHELLMKLGSMALDMREAFLFGIAHARRPIKLTENMPKIGDHIILWYKLPSGRITWCAGEVDGSDDGLFVDYEIDGQSLADSYAWLPLPQIPTVEGEG